MNKEQAIEQLARVKAILAKARETEAYVKESGLVDSVEDLLESINRNIETNPPPYGFDAETAAHLRGDCGVYYRRIAFDNGYAVSIVSTKFSYGGNDGLFEVAVMQASTNEIVYDTPITGSVLGYVDFAEVAEVIAKVKDLPPRIYWPKSAFTISY